MDYRSIIESPSPSESVANRPQIVPMFELRHTGRRLRGIDGVMVLVYASVQPNVGRAVPGEWHKPEQRWRAGSPTGLRRTIPIMLGHGFGAFHAPVGNSLFCFYGFQKTLCNERKKIFRTFRKCRASALGSMAHSLVS